MKADLSSPFPLLRKGTLFVSSLRALVIHFFGHNWLDFVFFQTVTPPQTPTEDWMLAWWVHMMKRTRCASHLFHCPLISRHQPGTAFGGLFGDFFGDGEWGQCELIKHLNVGDWTESFSFQSLSKLSITVPLVKLDSQTWWWDFWLQHSSIKTSILGHNLNSMSEIC